MQPLFYAALAFAGGDALAGYGPAWLASLGAIWMIAAWGAAAALLRRQRRMAAALALGLCASAGYGRAHWAQSHSGAPGALQQAMATLQTTPRTRLFLTGYVRDTPELLYDSGRLAAVRLDVEAASVASSKGAANVMPVSGGVRLYAYPPRPPVVNDNADPEAAPPPANASWAQPLERLQAGEGLAASVHLRPLRDYRDPGVADFTAAARREGIMLSATLPLDGWQRWPAVAGPGLQAARARLWRWLSGRLDRMAAPERNPRVNALLRGMLLGDVARLDEVTRTAFQIDGVYHLLVVAGLHIAVLAGFLWWVLRRFGLPGLAAEAVSLLMLAIYAWTIAGRTPTLRALLMLAVYFGARFWYRERQALNAVGAAALALLVWHPLDLFAADFQMSFGAATLLAGVALPVLQRSSQPLRRASRDLEDVAYDEAFAPKLAQWRLDLRALATRLGYIWRPIGWRLMPAGVRALLGLYEIAVISLVLQLGFAAFNALYFHRANPWSVVANALLVPAASALIPLAWLGLGLTALGGTCLRIAGELVSGLGGMMLAAADKLARWPAAQLRVPSPPGWFLMAFGVSTIFWLIGSTRLRRQDQTWPLTAAATAAMAALALALAVAPFPPRLPPGLTATVLDVGQGDSILVTFPDRRTLLVDGGPHTAHWDTGDEVVAPFLWSLGLKRIDAVLLTHAHNDHLGGLNTVVKDFRPSEVWVTRTLPPEAPVANFLRTTSAVGARLRRLDAGENLLAGAARLEVLLPPPAYQAGELASNDDSMVVRVSEGGDAMLLEGDAESGGERWTLDHGETLASALLKVGHHGSRTSSTPAFLAAVHPQVAIISVGANNVYGHPAPEVVARLEQFGARVFRTDHDGAVQCRLLGDRLEVYLFRPIPKAQ